MKTMRHTNALYMHLWTNNQTNKERQRQQNISFKSNNRCVFSLISVDWDVMIMYVSIRLYVEVLNVWVLWVVSFFAAIVFHLLAVERLLWHVFRIYILCVRRLSIVLMLFTFRESQKKKHKKQKKMGIEPFRWKTNENIVRTGALTNFFRQSCQTYWVNEISYMCLHVFLYINFEPIKSATFNLPSEIKIVHHFSYFSPISFSFFLSFCFFFVLSMNAINAFIILYFWPVRKHCDFNWIHFCFFIYLFY